MSGGAAQAEPFRSIKHSGTLGPVKLTREDSTTAAQAEAKLLDHYREP